MADYSDAIFSHFPIFLRRIILSEKAFYQAAIIYGIAISLLVLIVPMAIQTVINTVVNTAQELSLIILVSSVFILLILAACFYGLQIYVMELFQRRFFARTVAEMTSAVGSLKQEINASVKSNELVKRYFEIMFIQKSVPSLIVNGFSSLLHTLVGLMVVSFYHPFLFFFSMSLTLICLLVWRLFHRDMHQGAYGVSVEKYHIADMLENFIERHLPFSCEKTEYLIFSNIDQGIRDYISARKNYFRASFAQVMVFLSIYVLANAILLGLGGWLVIDEQLSIGQLVAAEIILSGVFAILPKLNYYLELYYELCVAARKLDNLIRFPARILNITEKKND